MKSSYMVVNTTQINLIISFLVYIQCQTAIKLHLMRPTSVIGVHLHVLHFADS